MASAPSSDADDHYLHPFLRSTPVLSRSMSMAISSMRGLLRCRVGTLACSPPLDGGACGRTRTTPWFYRCCDVAVWLCEQMHLSPGEMLDYLRSRAAASAV